MWNASATADGLHPSQNQLGVMLPTVPVAAFSPSFPANQVFYADAFSQGVTNVQAAISLLMGWAARGSVLRLTTDADATYTPYVNGRQIRDLAATTADRKLTLLTTSIVDGAMVTVSRAGSSGGHNRNVYQADGSTLIKAIPDSGWAMFTYDATAALWYEAAFGAL